MGELSQGFASSGGMGLLGSLSSGMSSYFGAQAEGTMAQSQYMGMQGQSETQSSQALIQASSLSNQYKVGAINMIMEAQAQQAEYDFAAAKYQIEGEGKRGQASVYESEAGIKLLDELYTMRNASITGVSALEVVRQGSEAEAKLREEGARFRGTQRSSIAAGGTDTASGNALDILRETDEGIESDSAALRYTAQKNRWQLLVQQQNMWMMAEVRKMESEQYKMAAEGLTRSAEMSDKVAGIMQEVGNLAMQSGEAGSSYYETLAEMAIKSGNVVSASYKSQGAMYGELGNITKKASQAKAIGGLLGTIAPAVGSFMGGMQGQSASKATKSPQGASYQGLPGIDQSWTDLAMGAGVENQIKINDATFGKFLPSKKVESYQSGFNYNKNWGLI